MHDLTLPPLPEVPFGMLLPSDIQEYAEEYGKACAIAATQWKTIDSAPKDGTEIVGAEWQRAGRGYEPELITQTTKYINGAWRYPSGIAWKPTHYMPLPPPPVISIGRGQMDGEKNG